MKKKVKNNLIGEQRQDKPANDHRAELGYIKALLTQTVELTKALINKIENIKKDKDNE
jgi:DNA-binding XRE family transcriptional regulator